MAKKEVMNLTDAAKAAGVHPSTMTRWIEAGEGPLAMVQLGRRRTFRIRRSDFDRCWRSRSVWQDRRGTEVAFDLPEPTPEAVQKAQAILAQLSADRAVASLTSELSHKE